jgi:hypothetical protein
VPAHPIEPGANGFLRRPYHLSDFRVGQAALGVQQEDLAVTLGQHAQRLPEAQGHDLARCRCGQALGLGVAETELVEARLPPVIDQDGPGTKTSCVRSSATSGRPVARRK